MTMTESGGLTLRERWEEAVQAADDAEQVLIDKGAASTDEDFEAAEAASKYMLRIGARYADSEEGQKFLAGKVGRGEDTVDGQTFDELAAESGIVNPKGMTIGEAFVKSEAYEELLAENLGADGSLRKDSRIKSRGVDFGIALTTLRNDLKFADDETGSKALVTGASATSAGALIEPHRMPGIVDNDPLRRTTLWDLCTKEPLSGTDTLEYVEITSRTNNAAFVAEATSADPDEADDVAAGRKPESGLDMLEVSNPVQTIAHWVPLTRRAAADAPRLVNLINTFLVRGLAVKIEDALLNGTGASPQIRGLLNGTNPYTGLQVIDISVKVAADSAYTRWDALAEGAALISTATEGLAMPTAVLIHPTDWFSGEFMLKKDANGNYINGGPFNSAAGNPWGLRPVLTTAVAQGNQVVGDWTEALIGDRQQAQLFMTDSHADFFTRNILTILGEQRLSFGVRMPQAFVNIVA